MAQMKKWDALTWEERIARWEQAARVLKELSPHAKRKHFNMSFWGEKTDCGTVACAAGHCGLDPWFRRRGFKMDFKPIDEWYNEKTDTIEPGFIPEISDAADFFGYTGSEMIFYNGDHRSVRTVIREIKDYVKELKAKAKGRSEEDPD
jgi:hypothetical protein